MCDNNFKSKLKRRKTFVENQQGTQPPKEAPNRKPTWRDKDGGESEESPENRTWGGPQAGRGESKAGTGPGRSPGPRRNQGWAPRVPPTSINNSVLWKSRNPDPVPTLWSRTPRSGRNLQTAVTGFLQKALWVGIFSF